MDRKLNITKHGEVRGTIAYREIVAARLVVAILSVGVILLSAINIWGC